MDKKTYFAPHIEYIRFEFTQDVLAGSVMPTNTPESGVIGGDEGDDGELDGGL